MEFWDKRYAAREMVEAKLETWVHYWLDGIQDDEHNVIFVRGTESGLAEVKRGATFIEVEPDRLVKVENGPALSSFVPG